MSSEIKFNTNESSPTNNYDWRVHKFGGTSVADAKCFRNVATIVERELLAINAATGDDPFLPKRFALVVSAMGAPKPGIKTTDLLLNCVKFATERNDAALTDCLHQIQTKHFSCVQELGLAPEQASHLKSIIQNDIHDIKDILKTVSLLKWSASRISELVSGYGVSKPKKQMMSSFDFA